MDLVGGGVGGGKWQGDLLGFTAITQVSFNKYLTKSGGDIKREQKKERAQKRISGDIQGNGGTWRINIPEANPEEKRMEPSKEHDIQQGPGKA